MWSARRRASAQSDAPQRLIQGASASEPAAIEDQLVRPPRGEVGLRWKLWERCPVPRSGSREGEVSIEAARIWLQARAAAFGLNLRVLGLDLILALRLAKPYDPREAAALEHGDCVILLYFRH